MLVSTLHDNYLIYPCYFDKFMSLYKNEFQNCFTERKIEQLFNSLKTPEEIYNEFQLKNTTSVPFAEKKYNDLKDVYQKIKNLFFNPKAIKGREILRNNVKKSKYIVYF
jgi:hypothetical protein